MEARAIVLSEPRNLALADAVLCEPETDDVIVEVTHTGISSGTERLLWSGEMPTFPGMGYPLVPGYETVGRVTEPGGSGRFALGDAVFVPGARCYAELRPLFGGAASRLVSPPDRLHRLDAADPSMTLFALAATAHHAVAIAGAPDLVIGHGVLGRLIARIAAAVGGPPPVVHEVSTARREGAAANVVDPASDASSYAAIIDASGDHGVIDQAVARLSRGGCLTLAGFYGARLSFAFPAAFMKEARLNIAAEWQAEDIVAVRRLIDAGTLSLDGLITHTASPEDAASAYRTAFEDPACLKMVLDWRNLS